MSQQGIDLLPLSVQASNAISQYRAVLVGTSTIPTVMSGAQVTTAGGKYSGISKRPAASGAMVDIACMGTAVWEAGAAVSAGASVVADASGRCITAAALTIATGATAVTSAAANGAGTIAGGDAPQFVRAQALQAASAAGDLIEVLLF